MPAQKDVLKLLKEDHDKVRKLLKQLESGPSRNAKSTLKKLQKEIQMHTDAEEHIVYPAYRDCVGSAQAKVTVEESRTEHMLVDVLLKQLAELRAGTPEFQGKASVLKEAVEHHADEEEKEMFPAMRKHCHEEDLVDLAKQVQERKKGNIQVQTQRRTETARTTTGVKRRGARQTTSGRQSTGRQTTSGGQTAGRQSGRQTTGRQSTSGRQAQTRQELYEEAKRKDIEGRSSMTKEELLRALRKR